MSSFENQYTVITIYAADYNVIYINLHFILVFMYSLFKLFVFRNLQYNFYTKSKLCIILISTLGEGATRLVLYLIQFIIHY